MENVKIAVLANFLEVESDELEVSTYDENTFTLGSKEYLVLTDEEANEKAKEYIRETLWAFNASWILSHSKIENNSRVQKAVEKMQSELSEDANELIYALIEDFDEFVENSIQTDGRGPFMSTYDGNENEEFYEGAYYYIYRVN